MALKKAPTALRKYTLKDAHLTGEKPRSFAFGMIHQLRMKGQHYTGKVLYGVLLDSRPDKLADVFDKECRVLSTLHHQNVAKFMGLCFTSDSPLPFLLSEELEDNLMDFLDKHANIEFSRKLSILLNVARGLEYLHTRSPFIVHCMLTARSIGLSSSLQAKITDTGVCQIVTPKKFSLTVNHTPAIRVYMPPEMTPFTLEFVPAMDVFSFGHIALHTANQIFPSDLLTPTYTPPDSKRVVARTELERRVHYFDLLHDYIGESHPLTNIIKRCLRNEPQKRPIATELLHNLSQINRREEEQPAVMRVPVVSKRKKLKQTSVALKKLCSKEDNLAECYKTGIPGKLEIFKGTGGFKKSGKWRMYMFQIIDSVLLYFKNYLHNPVGELPLRMVVEVTAFCSLNEPQYFPFHVRFIGRGTPWVLRAASEDNRTAWMEAINPGSSGTLDLVCNPLPSTALTPQGRSRSFSDPNQQADQSRPGQQLSQASTNAGYIPFSDILVPQSPSLTKSSLRRQKKVTEEPSTSTVHGSHYLTLLAMDPDSSKSSLAPPSNSQVAHDADISPSHAALNRLTKLLTQEEVELLINTIETAIAPSDSDIAATTEQEEDNASKSISRDDSISLNATLDEYDPYVVMEKAKPQSPDPEEEPQSNVPLPYHRVPLSDLLQYTTSSDGTTALSPANTTCASSDGTTALSPANTTCTSSDGTTALSPANTTCTSSDGTTALSPANTTCASSDDTTVLSPADHDTTCASSDDTTVLSPANTMCTSSDGTTALSPANTTCTSSDGTIALSPASTTCAPESEDDGIPLPLVDQTFHEQHPPEQSSNKSKDAAEISVKQYRSSSSPDAKLHRRNAVRCPTRAHYHAKTLPKELSGYSQRRLTLMFPLDPSEDFEVCDVSNETYPESYEEVKQELQQKLQQQELQQESPRQNDYERGQRAEKLRKLIKRTSSKELLTETSVRPEWTKPNIKQRIMVAGDSGTLGRMRKKALDISRSSLTNLERIGEGQFGQIYKATLQTRRGMSVLVVVKSVKYESEEAGKFRSEMSIMSTVVHPNIVCLYGLVKEVDWMVMEYLPYGDLKMFLTRNKRPLPKLAKYMMEIAMGMHYLSAQGLIHRDLAARNVIVGVDEVCKVSDFGLLRELPKDLTIYKATGSHPSPIRWMAPESILNREFSVASDVWSFGIVQWEMFNPTLSPYQELDNMQCAAQIPSGTTMAVPRECPEPIQEVVKSCWKMDPEKRPSFVLISTILTNFLLES